MNRKDDGIKTSRSIILNVITSAISIVVSLFTTIIITRIISVSDLGIATSFVTLKNILNLICLVSIYISINRMILDIKGKDYEYLSSIYIFSSAFCLFSFILYLIFHSFLNSIFGFNTSMMILMFTMIFLINACNLTINYWNFKNKYKYMFIYNLLASPVAQILSLVFASLMTSHKYLGRIIGIDLFNILFGLGCGIYILYRGRFSFNTDYVKKSLKICIPMIPHLLAQILLSSCDLLMIRNIVGNNAAGIYSMAYTISNILYTILIQLFMPWSPWVYRRIKNNEIDAINKNSNLLIVGAGFLCLCLYTVAPDMIHIFLGKEYFEAAFIVAPITVGIFFQIMYIFFYDIEYYYKKNKQIACFSVIASIINIVLNYIFIKKFGYIAAAYTTFISYLILLVLHYFGMKRVDKRKFYNIKILFISSVCLLVIALLFIVTKNNFYLRYIIMLSFGIILLKKYYKDIKIFLNSIIKSKECSNES